MKYFLNSGTILHDKYKIVKPLGQGGFGITYLANHIDLQQNVCVKELFIPGLCSRESGIEVKSQNTKELNFSDFIDRFTNEARELAKFSHPGIVKVSDMFCENGTAYFVMNFIEGKTLKEWVTENGTLLFEDVRPIFLQLLEALDQVHKMGMLHRDIKPDNIIITPDKRAVLIDFGSARSYGSGQTITQTAILTPGYAPIEQYSEKARRGPYTDIYSMGASLYFVLTGIKPMPATERSFEAFHAPHEINSSINETISSAIMLAMNLNPDDRFQSIAEFREALEYKPADNVQHAMEKSTQSESKGKTKRSKGNKWLTWWRILILIILSFFALNFIIKLIMIFFW